MKVAIASGKGGTGKTTVSASLVSVWKSSLIAMDLDVEEPNLHLFLNPAITGTTIANMEIPKIDETRCTFCRECADLCQFKAISMMGEIVMTFPEMCHGCGGCMAVCREGAVTTDYRELGEICRGGMKNGEFLMGRLRVGEAMSPPLMREAKKELDRILAEKDMDVIIDAPPGVSCPAVNAVMDTDVIVLVTEPTPFGLYDLRLAVEAFTPLGKSMGVVLNRAGLGNNDVLDFCSENNLRILAQIPYDRKIAEAYAGGSIIADHSPEMKDLFISLAEDIRRLGYENSFPKEASHA